MTLKFIELQRKAKKTFSIISLSKMKIDYSQKGQQFTYSVLILIHAQFNNMGPSFDYVIGVIVYFV